MRIQHLNKVILLWAMLPVMLVTGSALAKNSNPSSGRHLQYDHWLTCSGGDDQAVRSDPPFTWKTPQAEVDQYVSQISQPSHWSGTYAFQVQDTWQEWVTHSGSDCSHCGETCRSNGDKNNTQTCSCNFCSWQELETFYRPWSTQKVNWQANYQPTVDDQTYQKNREDWIANGSHRVSRSTADLPKLLVFDPERAYKAFLFPGEAELITATNAQGIFHSEDSISPAIEIREARHQYSYTNRITDERGRGYGTSLQCDDLNYNLEATFQAGQRLVTTSPNSLQFKPGWLQGEVQGDKLKSATFRAKITDLGAASFKGQSVLDHYEDTQIQVRVEEVNRTWWFDRFITEKFTRDSAHLQPTYDDTNREDKIKIGFYTLPSSDLLNTPWFHTSFELHPGKEYKVCGRVIRKNNIYYTAKNGWGPVKWDAWSDYNCAQFEYLGPDNRSGGRKFHDFWQRIFPIF